jgi:hypothetical protein
MRALVRRQHLHGPLPEFLLLFLRFRRRLLLRRSDADDKCRNRRGEKGGFHGIQSFTVILKGEADIFRSVLFLICLTALYPQTPGERNGGGRPLHNEAQRLAKWKEVDIPAPSGLSARERQMVDKLVDACRQINDVYWRQMDLGGLELYKTTRNPTLKALLSIMGQRWDLLDENRPFIGEQPMPPGHELYPHDLTRAAIEAYVRQHPEDKAGIYSPYTVVRRRGDRLIAIPYHQEYKPFIDAMVRDLRAAAALSDDPAFAKFLRLRADSLLTDDYYASDLAWLDLKNPKFDVIFAPYETYNDELLGVKATYGAAVLIRNDAESRKLALYEKYVPQLQDALPVEASMRPSKKGHLTPMEVMDTPYRGGDLRYGYQAVADNLPNDPKVHQDRGSKKIFFRNFLYWRMKAVIQPISQQLMDADQAANVNPEAFLAGTVMHEISHELGPEFATVNGKHVPINEAIGPASAALEEAKADIAGMFGLEWLIAHNVLPAKERAEDYASYVASLFRTLRFGAGEAHGRAETMEFNYLLDAHAVNFQNGRYHVDYARMPQAIAALAKELLEIEATGDRQRAEKWFEKYGRIPAELNQAFARLKAIPVEVYPKFAFPDNVM